MNKYTGIRFYSRFGLALRFAAILSVEFGLLALFVLC